MYAIVRDSGQQFKVAEGQKLVIDERPDEVGAILTFPDVLLFSAGDDLRIGTPIVKNVTITAEVLRHLQGDKVIAFKYKAKVRYRRRLGHRQRFTRLSVQEIVPGD